MAVRSALLSSFLGALVALSLPGCNGSGNGNEPVDFAGADLYGVDLTGLSFGDMAGPVMVSPTSAVTIVVEPGDNGDMLVAAITGAATSIHMTMYQLTSTRVINALKSRKAAGKEVKVLLNKTFPGGMGSNASVYSELMAAGVEVRYAPANFQYTHEKALVIDNTTAFIMTMNASDSAFSGNREFVAIDTDSADVAETEAVFQADWAGTAITPSGKLLVAPDNAEAQLVALVDGATKTVDLEGEVLSADSILQALGRAQKRGCAVRIVLSDQTPTSAGALAITQLKQVGIPVRSLSNPYIHSKAIVTDGSLAYVGSENFTQNSLQNNRELGLVVGKQSEVDKVAGAIDADFKAGTAL
jgi:phosphatidylserine/phosphatidylglycerophosphate/cardiolipin synthase-like enzyme